MGLKEYIINNEKIFSGKKDIKYFFCEKKESDKLIVTFPGFSSPGKPPEYNYVRTLIDCNCHKLFILDDYGPRGSYLIGENRDNSIEDSVIDLIKTICKEKEIERNNVILQGSSKGGFCALYFGIKYQFGYVIAGGPQVNLGNYIFYVAPEVGEYITGGNDENDIKYLNSLIYNLINLPSKNFPKIFLHVGKGDHHYKGHILPLLEKLDQKDIRYEIDLPNYYSHTSVGMYYPDYLLKTLNNIDTRIVCQKPEIVETDIYYENCLLNISCFAKGDNLEYSFYIFKENDIIEKTGYQKEPILNYSIQSNGIFRARIFVKEGFQLNSKYTDEIQIKKC